MVCSYCGAGLVPFGDENAEMSALEQYHKHIETATPSGEQCSRLITGGFVPSGLKPLIEAGHRCLPMLEPASVGDCKDQWAVRLGVISTRLKVLGGEEAGRAVAEFDARIKAWKDQSDSDTRNGLGCIAILLAMIVGIGWWIFRRLLM